MSAGGRLYREPANAKLFGVCAGIARHLSVDPLIVRIGAFALGLIFSWFAVIAYGVLAYALPPVDGETAPQRPSRAPATTTPEPRSVPDDAPSNSQQWEADYSWRDDMDEIEQELEEMKAAQAERLAQQSPPAIGSAIPKTLEGDTTRKSGRSLEGVPANKRKV